MPPPDELSSDIRALIVAIGENSRAISDLAKAIGATHVDHESRIRKIEEIVIMLKERMGIWQLAQAGYTTVASAIAAAISLLRR